MKNYDLNLFKIFYIVAKYKSFTKAAEILYITQPAISQSIKKLEEQLNAELFQRTNKGIELTEAGKAVFNYSEQLYSLVSSSDNLVKKITNEKSKEIKIGVPTHNSYYINGTSIAELYKKYTNIKITVMNDRVYEMMKMLEKGEIDIVVGTNLTSELKNIQIDQITNIESCFVANNGYLLKNKELSFNELNNYPLILPTSDSNDRKMLNLIAKKYHIEKLNSIVECNSTTICKKLLNNNLGIAWMKKDMVKNDIQSGKLIEVKVAMDKVLMPYSVAYNKNFITEPQKYLIDLLKETNLL